MDNKRVKWVDYAKGIAIILMVLAHSLRYDNFFRIFIYSFHMTLFFILTGYNMKNAKNCKELFYMIYKDFKGLVIPYILVIIFCCIVKYWDYGLVYIFKNMFYSILWGNGIIGSEFFQLFGVWPIFGPFWFLICLFWAKIIIRLIELYVVKYFRVWLYLILIFIGLMVGFYYNIPLSFDISLVSLLFIKLGQYYKNYEKFLSKFDKYLCIIFVLIWCICVGNGFYIDLAVRYYSKFIVSIIESICGSFAIIYLCKYLEIFNLRFLGYIGRCSLIILIVHSVEFNLIDYSYLLSIIGNSWLIFFKVFLVMVVSILIDNVLRRVRRLW